MTKHFTVLELGADLESPMVGTFLDITTARLGHFQTRLKEALEEHFDSEVFLPQPFPNVVETDYHTDIKIDLEESIDHEIRIIQTWIY